MGCVSRDIRPGFCGTLKTQIQADQLDIPPFAVSTASGVQVQSRTSIRYSAFLGSTEHVPFTRISWAGAFE